MPAIANADSSTVVSQILALCGCADEASDVGSSASSHSLQTNARLTAVLAPFIRKQSFILHLGRFVFTNNLCMNVAFHPAFLELSQRVHADLQNVVPPAKITPMLALEVADLHLQHIFGSTWCAYTCTLLSLEASNEYSPLELTAGVLSEAKLLKELITVRCKYVLGLLRCLGCGEGKVFDTDLSEMLIALSEQLHLLSWLDSASQKRHCLLSSWQMVLTGWNDGSALKSKLDDEIRKLERGEGDGDDNLSDPDDESRSLDAPDAAPSTEHDFKASVMSLAQIKVKWTGNEGVSFSVLHSFALHLESFIYDKCHVITTRLQASTTDAVVNAGPSGSSFDGDLEHVFADFDTPGKEVPVLTASVLTEKLNFNFSGKIVLSPVKDSIKICEAFGVPFYLDGSACQSFKSDFFVPAWMIKETKPTKADPGALKGVLEVRKMEMPFEYVYFLFGNYTILKTKVTMFSLHVKEWFIGDVGSVVLTRDPIAEQQKPDKLPKQPKAPPPAAAIPIQFREAKHLYR